ncbi:hypothetical protein HYD71_00895 [Mycoplasmopsis bovis]|nr:hypothetical protein [Mycoplasmopsis bovis]QQH49466.1 hypothetical protein HYD71_00895 [Mycoplasmopsis bovis]
MDLIIREEINHGFDPVGDESSDQVDQRKKINKKVDWCFRLIIMASNFFHRIVMLWRFYN